MLISQHNRNPGTVALEFGDLIFNAAIADVIIGNMTVSDATLYQGNNTFPFVGIIDLTTVVANCRWSLAKLLISLYHLLDLFRRYPPSNLFNLALPEDLSSGRIFLDFTSDKGTDNTIMANASSNASDAYLVMALSGNSCLINGQHITYVEAVLDNTTLYSNVPVSDF